MVGLPGGKERHKSYKSILPKAQKSGSGRRIGYRNFLVLLLEREEKHGGP
jgi:hypothetical protein